MSHITNTADMIPGLRVHVLMVGGKVEESRVRAIRVFRDNEYAGDVPGSTANRRQVMVFWEPKANGDRPNGLSHTTNHADWYSYLSTLGITHDSARFKSAFINGVFHTFDEAIAHRGTDEYIKACADHEAICVDAENKSDRLNYNMDDQFGYDDGHDPFSFDAHTDRMDEVETERDVRWNDIDPLDHQTPPEPRDDPESVEHYQRSGGGSNLGDILADALARQNANENEGDGRS